MLLNQSSISIRHELRQTLHLSIPLCIAYGGNKLLGLVDTAIIGRLGATEIAGASIGNALFFLATIIGTGILMGLDPLISQAVGAGKNGVARGYLRSGVWLATGMFIPITALLFLTWGTILEPIGITSGVQESTLHYLLGRTPSILFYYLFTTMRCYLQSHQITRPILLSTIIANIANVPLSIFLTLGDRGLLAAGLPPVGFEGWGVFGAATGTSIVTLLQMGTLWWAIKQVKVKEEPPVSKRKGIQEVISIGYPISLQMLAEGGLFVTVTLLMGRFGENQLGGHQIALQIASFSFTVCLGLSSATSVRVGQAIGRKDPAGAKQAGLIGIGVAAVFMSCSGLLMYLGASPLAHFFAKPPKVIEATITFLGIAAVFQLFDGLQAVASGALRGAGKTQLAFIFNLISHWGFGMPTALFMAFYLGVGSSGLWWGLTAGLFVGSITLTTAFARTQIE